MVCEIEFRKGSEFRNAKWVLALRNFALRNFRIANLILRNFRIAKLELALRNRFWHCEIEFGIAKLAWLLRSAQCPAATVPLVLHPAASHPAFNCISFSSLCLGFSFDLWVV